MKYTFLALSLMTFGMVGCASQPFQNSQNLLLNQKVYHSYEKLVSTESYAFDGKMSFKTESTEKNKQKDTSITISEQTKRQQILQQLLQQPHTLSTIQQQWLREGVDQQSKSGGWDQNKAARVNSLIQALFNRYYMSVDGVVDLKQGQISVNPKLGYAAKNAQGWITFPMVVDLRQSKAYADISALSPLLTDPKYDGQYVVFDYAELLKKSRLDTKPLLEVMREYMLVNAALTPEKNYQSLALTTADKQIGGTQRIRYIANYNEIMAQYMLFFYLNGDYLKSIIPQAEQLTKNVNITSLGQVMAGKPLPADLLDTSTTATKSLNETDALYRLYDAIDVLATADSDINTDSVMNHENAISNVEDKVDTAPFLLADQQQQKYLQSFAAYKTNKLVSAQQMQKIVAEQPQAYAELIRSVAETFKDINIFPGDSFQNDLVLDSKGRMIRSEMDFKIGDFTELGIENFKITGAVNFHSYGLAKIDQQQLKNAISFKQAANENTLLNLGRTWDKFSKETAADTKNSESQSWTKTRRYEKLAESLLQQGLNFIEIYTTVYRYAYLLEGEDVDSQEFNLKDLNDTARWTAIYYADEFKLPLTTQQKSEYENSPEEWYYYDEHIAEAVWQVISKQQNQQKLNQQLNQLRKQGKTDAQIFSQIYLDLETEYEQRVTGEKNIKFDQRFQQGVKMLGEIAVEDMKTQKINTEKLKQFDVNEVLNAETYKQVYKLFID